MTTLRELKKEQEDHAHTTTSRQDKQKLVETWEFLALGYTTIVEQLSHHWQDLSIVWNIIFPHYCKKKKQYKML
jgi:hypothetical protein